jgi:hypothetical protein
MDDIGCRMHTTLSRRHTCTFFDSFHILLSKRFRDGEYRIAGSIRIRENMHFFSIVCLKVE